MATPSARIQDVVRRARRRVIVMIALDEACWAAAGGLAAFCFLLLAGARIFDWRWTGLILASATAWAGWRTRRSLPDAYRVARQADAGLGLRDLLATAWHYGLPDMRKRANEQFLSIVESKAEQACRRPDLKSAVPLRWTRSAWIAAGALASAVLLFTVRVGLLRTFDLRAPLVAVNFDTLTGATRPAPEKKEIAKTAFPPFGVSVQEPEQAYIAEKDLVVEESLRSVDASNPGSQRAAAAERKSRDGEGQDAGEGSEDGEASKSGKDTQPAASEDARKRAERGRQDQGRKPTDNSLLDKMRDALANLMDKFKLEMPPGDGKQTMAKGNSREAQSKGEKGSAQKGRPNDQGQSEEAQAGNQKAGANSAQQAKSDQAGPRDESSQNEKSGIGRQDGRKEVELAEQQQAMGKLSELLGKRSLNVQAEVMVEVTNSNNQQLRTPYVNRTGHHMEAGSDLNRDEVPLHLQEYIQRYYEQVRRNGARESPK